MKRMLKTFNELPQQFLNEYGTSRVMPNSGSLVPDLSFLGVKKVNLIHDNARFKLEPSSPDLDLKTSKNEM